MITKEKKIILALQPPHTVPTVQDHTINHECPSYVKYERVNIMMAYNNISFFEVKKMIRMIIFESPPPPPSRTKENFPTVEETERGEHTLVNINSTDRKQLSLINSASNRNEDLIPPTQYEKIQLDLAKKVANIKSVSVSQHQVEKDLVAEALTDGKELHDPFAKTQSQEYLQNTTQSQSSTTDNDIFCTSPTANGPDDVQHPLKSGLRKPTKDKSSSIRTRSEQKHQHLSLANTVDKPNGRVNPGIAGVNNQLLDQRQRHTIQKAYGKSTK